MCTATTEAMPVVNCLAQEAESPTAADIVTQAVVTEDEKSRVRNVGTVRSSLKGFKTAA